MYETTNEILSKKRIDEIINRKVAKVYFVHTDLGEKEISLRSLIQQDPNWAEYKIRELENDIRLTVKPILERPTNATEEELQEQIDDLEDELQDAQYNLDNATADIDELTERIDVLEGEIEDLEERNKNLSHDLDDANEKIQNQIDEISRLEDEISR